MRWTISQVFFWTLRTLKKHRHLCILAGLWIRSMSAGFEWAAEHLFQMEQLISEVEKIASETLWVESWAIPLSPWSIDPSLLPEMYAQVRLAVKPYLPWFIWFFVLSSLVTTLLYMLISYTIFDDESWTNRWWKEKFSTWITQLIPYRLTVIFQWIIILIWFWFFLIPWFIALVYFWFTQPTILKEKIYGWSAMKRSYTLVKGRWRNTLWNIIFISICLWVFATICVSIIDFITGHVSSDILSRASIWIFSTFIWVLWRIALTYFYLIWNKSALLESSKIESTSSSQTFNR